MISLVQQYNRSLAWFICGLVLAVLLSFGISNLQPATVFNQNNYVPDSTASVVISEFAATHQEPNFYQ